MVERTPPSGIQALKRTVFISHGDNARRIGRTRREPALSGALSAERTPHFARSFCLLQNVGKMYRLLGGEGWIRTLGAARAPMRRIRPAFGALFGPTKGIRAGENLFAWDSTTSALSSSLRSPRLTPMLGRVEHQTKPSGSNPNVSMALLALLSD